MTTERPLRVAVAGLGYWGPNIARNFARLPDTELAWCCDASEENRARVAEQFPGAAFTGDLDDVLADDTVDAVALRTPGPDPRCPRAARAQSRQALLRREADGAVLSRGRGRG